MSKCWYCNNELTSGDSPKHFGICNKCYDKMFKSGDTIIRSLTNKISDLEAKLAEKEKVSPKSSIKEIVKSQDIKCFFRDKTLAQIQKCGDVYSPEYGYFNFEDDYDELLNNKKDDRFDIVAIEVIKTTKSGN